MADENTYPELPQELLDRLALEPPPADAHEGPMDYAVLPLRDACVFPQMIVPFGVIREKSIRALQEAKRFNEPIMLISQRRPLDEDPDPENLHRVGTVARVLQMLELPDGTLRLVVEGVFRARVRAFDTVAGYLRALVEPLTETGATTMRTKALMRTVVGQFEETVSLKRNIPPEALVTALNLDDGGRLADVVAAYLNLNVDQKQALLEMSDTNRRLEQLARLLAEELELLHLEQSIHSRVRESLDGSQREYYLREQARIIQEELSENEGMSADIQAYRERIEAAQMSEEATEKALAELQRLERMPPISPEVSVIRTYIEWLTELPWTTQTQDELDINIAEELLDADHFGLKKVKERVLEFLAVHKLVDQVKGPILCFMGPPGVGKTSIGKSIARSMNREFVRLSLGGVHDEAEIRGHRRTYVGALPGRVIQALRRVKSNNPVFMIDEIDKIGQDFRGDPSSALLEVLDPEQNDSFSDHYLEVPFDLSKVMFIATGNVLDTVPPALRDRMEVIEFPGYIEEEKFQIAKRFLVPKQRKAHGLKAKHVAIPDKGLRHLIRHYTHEAGVRSLEREVASLCRKVARGVAGGADAKTVVDEAKIAELLGPERYRYDRKSSSDRIGIATGLSYTPAGGDIISIEVSVVPGDGDLVLTGRLGEVMKESAQAALSYARLRSPDLGLAEGFFEKHDIHIHVPSGAVPKEGPSAGIAIATALVSALTKRPVRNEVAMTGEVTLHGKVLPIGGVREKVLAAHRAGIRTVLLPAENERDLRDLDEVPAEVRRDIRFVFVEQMPTVLDEALA